MLEPRLGYMNQYINSNGQPHGFVFSIHSDFLTSQFVSLNVSYHFPLLSSKLFSVFLAVFFRAPAFYLFYQFSNIRSFHTPKPFPTILFHLFLNIFNSITLFYIFVSNFISQGQHPFIYRSICISAILIFLL